MNLGRDPFGVVNFTPTPIVSHGTARQNGKASQPETHKNDDHQSVQLAPIESKREDGRGHRAEGGINAAARELGIEATAAKRATKVAAINTDSAGM